MAFMVVVMQDVLFDNIRATVSSLHDFVDSC
jgi:hypothetical protein